MDSVVRRGEHQRGPIAVVEVHLRATLLVRVAVGLALAFLVAGRAMALNPELDISQYAHTAWKVRDGFVKGRINSIAQTPDGYLWLSTDFGLFRFDGVHAVPWQPPGGEQLPSNFTSRLLVTRDGTLWIGTLKGICSWKDGKLTKYPEPATQIGPLLEDREGTVWFGTYVPARLCAVKNSSVKCYGEGIFDRSIDALYEDRKGNLWVASATGLWRWAPGRAEQFKFPNSKLGPNSLVEDDRGTLLVATSDGVKQLADGKIQNYTLPGTAGNIRSFRLFRSHDGSLWVGSTQGLFHLHQGKTDRFRVADGLSDGSVTSIFEDREGSVWVTTANGLDRFREYALTTISRDQGLSTENAFLVQASANGTIWIGTADGLNRWENGHVTIYDRQSVPDLNRGTDAREPSVSSRSREVPESGITGGLRALGHDDQGRLWVGTSTGNFYFEAGRFHRVAGMAGGNIWSISGDGHGNMWINDGNAGLSYVVPGEPIQQIPLPRLGRKYLGARAALPDRSQGGIWLGFYDGGLAYFKDGQVRASYTSADGLGNGRVNDLRFGSRGTLWAATEGGLSRIRDGRIQTLTSKNGLPCDEVHWSIEDDEHFVWLYMPCGLMRVGRSELDAWVRDSSRKVQLASFDSSDGVMSLGVYGSSGPHVSKTPDGKIWFVHTEGVSVIDPRHLPFNKIAPPVYIEQVTANGKIYDATLAGSSDGTGPMRLPALIRDLQIDYTALSLVAPEKVRFRYKLEGWDRDWQEVGNRRQAFYNNLSPRKYRFRVMACNNSGVWNEAGTFVDFSVAPAYYQSTWFRASAVGVFAALLFALYQLRLRQLSQQFKMRMEERVHERERIARDLHDTFLQSVQGLVLKFAAVAKQIPCEEGACQAMEDALDLADAVLAEGRDRVRNLRDATLSLGDLPAAFRRVAEECPHGGSADFKAVVEGNVRELHPLVLEESFCIGREALTNALTHSGGQHVEAEITYDAKQFRLRVRDDGRGIDASILEKGREDHWGMRGMRERAQRIGAQLKMWSRPGSGTEVELMVPAATAYRSGSARPKVVSWFRFGFRRTLGSDDGEQL